MADKINPEKVDSISRDIPVRRISTEKMSKGQILEEIKKRMKRIYGDLYSEESRVCKNIIKRLSSQTKEQLTENLEAWQGFDNDRGLIKIQKLVEENLAKLKKEYEKTLILFSKDKEKYKAKLDDLEKKIVELENEITRETIDLIESRDYRQSLPEETVRALKGMKFADPLEDVRKIHDKGYTGKGVTIVILDSGIDPNHPDFKGRIKFFKDFVENKEGPYDDKGHGTHVAGIAAGSGEASDGRFKGVAPEADIIVLKVISDAGHLSMLDFKRALEWINANKEKYNIKVINTSCMISESNWDFVRSDVDKVLDKGMAWVDSAGNLGKDSHRVNYVNYPGKTKRIISVGSSDQLFTLSKDDDTLDVDSSWGKTSWSDSKPNLLAPGVNIVAPLALKSEKARKLQDYSIDVNSDGKGDYVYGTGTSMSSPYIAGLVALLLQANPNLTSNDIRYILMDTADSIKDIPNYIQGAGKVNPQKALKRALYLKKKKEGMGQG